MEKSQTLTYHRLPGQSQKNRVLHIQVHNRSHQEGDSNRQEDSSKTLAREDWVGVREWINLKPQKIRMRWREERRENEKRREERRVVTCCENESNQLFSQLFTSGDQRFSESFSRKLFSLLLFLSTQPLLSFSIFLFLAILVNNKWLRFVCLNSSSPQTLFLVPLFLFVAASL